MNYGRNPELIDRLAGEYVLGTLRGAARLRFARLGRENASARRALREWEGRLVPMGEALPAIVPPGRLWRAIQMRIQADRAASARGFFESLAFWRGFGLIASGCAAALIVAFSLQKPQIIQVPVDAEVPARQMQPSYIATIKDKDGYVVLLAYAARNSDELWIKKSGVKDIPGDRSFELWGLSPEKGAAPKSLGVLPPAEKGTIKLAAVADKSLADFSMLAVSLEPAGGSKSGAPTGPVLYTGPCFKFW